MSTAFSDRIAPPDAQPAHFAFNAASRKAIRNALAKYPRGREASAVLPVLDIAQRQHGGWIPMRAIEEIAGILGMAQMRVLEVASFYTMFNLRPVGKYHIQLCGTTPCMLRGSEDVKEAIASRLGIKPGETSACGNYTLTEVECLGACVNAPMIQINDDYYEDLDADSMAALIDAMEKDTLPEPGSVIGRQGSQPMKMKAAKAGTGGNNARR